jgi:hypothetical protein
MPRQTGVVRSLGDLHRLLRQRVEIAQPNRKGMLPTKAELAALSAAADAPCPICNGVEGCDHTVTERRRRAGH